MRVRFNAPAAAAAFVLACLLTAPFSSVSAAAEQSLPPAAAPLPFAPLRWRQAAEGLPFHHRRLSAPLQSSSLSSSAAGEPQATPPPSPAAAHILPLRWQPAATDGGAPFDHRHRRRSLLLSSQRSQIAGSVHLGYFTARISIGTPPQVRVLLAIVLNACTCTCTACMHMPLLPHACMHHIFAHACTTPFTTPPSASPLS